MNSPIHNFYNYYLTSSISFFRTEFNKRVNFIKKKKFLFNEISSFINNCFDNTKNIFFLCAGNSIITKNIEAKNIYIKEICDDYNIKYNDNAEYLNEISEDKIYNCDTIVIADIEHQNKPAINLENLTKIINENAKVIIISKNIFWMIIVKILKFFIDFSPQKNNFLPTSYLKNLFSSCNLEIIRQEKIIAFPIYIPFITKFINRLFRLPILNFFCILNVYVLKKTIKTIPDINTQRVSFIIPCKNEQENIKYFKDEIKQSSENYEFIFGDDKSKDNTYSEIKKLIETFGDKKVKIYDGPGICKSENVYMGIEQSKGDIIVIYDADLTVSFFDVYYAINVLNQTNSDFINCTRMIYTQKNKAMKTLNFFGNIFFANLFSVLFKKTITDTLCGTKIFYKKDWNNIKKNNSKWGAKDLWGDFDLLIGAYKNNLKITEVPITYYERKENETKMNSLFSNTLRMLFIVFSAYYKLRLKK